MLKRSPSTVCRERNRNDSYGQYDAVFASHIAKNDGEKLCENRLKILNINEPKNRVSHETIYAMIYAYPRGELRTDLIKSLRQSHKKSKPRARRTDRRGQL